MPISYSLLCSTKPIRFLALQRRSSMLLLPALDVLSVMHIMAGSLVCFVVQAPLPSRASMLLVEKMTMSHRLRQGTPRQHRSPPQRALLPPQRALLPSHLRQRLLFLPLSQRQLQLLLLSSSNGTCWPKNLCRPTRIHPRISGTRLHRIISLHIFSLVRHQHPGLHAMIITIIFIYYCYYYLYFVYHLLLCFYYYMEIFCYYDRSLGVFTFIIMDLW